MSSQTLKDKTIKGVGWSAVDQVSNQGITFFVSLVLARLLSPDEYGLIGIITIFISVFNIFIISGFNAALIRKKNANDRDFNTVFWFNMAVSVVLFGVLWLIAPGIADFFERVELTALIRTMGVLLLINAFALIQTTILTKQIDFKKQTKVSLIASLSSGTIGIGMALCGLGVWSLVGQQISRQGFNSLFLWIWSKWRPRLEFSTTSFKELWGFGWKLLVSGLLNTIWGEMYQVIVGKFYAPATLGQYARAHQFAGVFSSNLTTIVQRVSYPVLSSIQDDREHLKEGYRKVIKSTMLVTFICMLMLAAIAKPMVLVLIGEKWLPCVVFLQLICFSMMLYPLHALNLNMLEVQGRSDLFLKLEIIKKVIAIGPICLGIFYSIYAMVIASVFVGFISYYLNAYYSGPFLHYGIRHQVRDIQPSFFVAAGIALPVYLLSFLSFSPFLLLPLQLFVGAVLAVVLCETTKLPEYLEIREIILKVIRKFRKE